MRTRIAITLFLSLIAFTVSAAEMECLSASDARAVVASEREGPYFSLLQPREMYAKTGQQPVPDNLAGQREWVRSTYEKAVLDCTEGERLALQGYVSIIESQVSATYPGLFNMPWRFVKVTNAVEGGLPHTVGGVIVLSQSVMQALEESARAGQLSLQLANILIHEQVHVLQRANMKPFATLYEKEFGFKRVERVVGFESWRASHQVVNPDGVDVQWVWPVPDSERLIWPLVVLSGDSQTPRMPDDFAMVGIELTAADKGYQVVSGENGEPRYGALREESPYMKKFRGISSIYHPNEIAADYIADLVVWDCLLDKSSIPAQKLTVIESLYAEVRPWVKGIVGN